MDIFRNKTRLWVIFLKHPKRVIITPDMLPQACRSFNCGRLINKTHVVEQLKVPIEGQQWAVFWYYYLK